MQSSLRHVLLACFCLGVSVASARNVCPANQPYCFFDKMPLYTQDDPREVNPGEYACGLCIATSGAMTLAGAFSEDYYGAYYNWYFSSYYGPAVGDYYGRYYSARPGTVMQSLYAGIPDSNYYPRVNYFAHAIGTDMHYCGGAYMGPMANVMAQRATDFWGGGGSGSMWYPYLPTADFLASLVRQKIAGQILVGWNNTHVERRFNKFYLTYNRYQGHATSLNGFNQGGLPEGGVGPVPYIFNPWGIREWYYTKVLDSVEHPFPSWPAPFTYQDYPPSAYSTVMTTGDSWWLRFIPEFRASNNNAAPILIKFVEVINWVWSD